MPGFTFLTTLFAGLGALGIRPLSSRYLGVGLVGGLALTGAGLNLDFDWLINVGVIVTAVFIGTGIGRVVPPQPGPILRLLLLLSVVDIVWVFSGGGTAVGWVDEVVNFSVYIGTRSSSIGTVDLVLSAAIAAHRLRRGSVIWLAIAAAPVGMAPSSWTTTKEPHITALMSLSCVY